MTHQVWITQQDENNGTVVGTLYSGTVGECNAYMAGWRCSENGTATVLPSGETPEHDLVGMGQTPAPFAHPDAFKVVEFDYIPVILRRVWRTGTRSECESFLAGANLFEDPMLEIVPAGEQS